MQGQSQQTQARGASPEHESNAKSYLNEKKEMSIELNYLKNFIFNEKFDNFKDLNDLVASKAQKSTIDPEI